MGMRRGRLTAAAILILVAALGGCSPTTPSPTPLKLVTSGTPTLSGMEALLTASIVVDDEGCVIAQTAEPDVPLVLVWPQGYSVHGDAREFQILDAAGEIVASAPGDYAIAGGSVDSVGADWDVRNCANGPLWMVGDLEPA
jgi:hypothetical protein